LSKSLEVFRAEADKEVGNGVRRQKSDEAEGSDSSGFYDADEVASENCSKPQDSNQTSTIVQTNVDRHELVLDLRVDSEEPRMVTAQRSIIKFGDNLDQGVTVDIVMQFVQCGTNVRKFEAMYGSIPNPTASRDSDEQQSKISDQEGSCVVCLENPKEVLILHCKHVCLCRDCARLSSSTWSFQCPVCRERVCGMLRVDKFIEPAYSLNTNENKTGELSKHELDFMSQARSVPITSL